MKKYILIFVGGAAAGAAAVYGFMRKKFHDFKKLQKNFEKVQEQTLEHAVDTFDHAVTAEKVADELTALYSDSDEEVPEEVTELAPEEDPLSELGAYAITIADFMDDPEYTKIYCEYHKEIDVLINTQNGKELDKKETLGEMWEMLNGYTGDEMYIRNEDTKTDYEIDFNPDAFDDGGE